MGCLSDHELRVGVKEIHVYAAIKGHLCKTK